MKPLMIAVLVLASTNSLSNPVFFDHLRSMGVMQNKAQLQSDVSTRSSPLSFLDNVKDFYVGSLSKKLLKDRTYLTPTSHHLPLSLK